MPGTFNPNDLSTDHISERTSAHGVAVDGLTIKDSGFALGSDADGDIYYRASGALARLAKGTGSQTLKMNSGATAPEWVTVAGGDIPSGTKMLFYADTAPSGWTIDNTLDDKVVFITKGSSAGGQTGGGAHSSGTWTQPNHTHTGPSHTHTTAAMTLDTAKIPSHAHGIPLWQDPGGLSIYATRQTTRIGTENTDAAGGGNSHEHGATGADGTGATGDGATANTWRPAAYCMIICSKN